MAEPLYADSPRSRAIRLLREMIADGTLPAGAQLPAERTLADRLDVPRTTVNRAVQSLQEAGLIKHLGGRTRVVTERGARKGLMSRSVVVIAPPLDSAEPHPDRLGVAEDMTTGCERELRADDLFTLVVSSRNIGSAELRHLVEEGPLGVIVTDVSIGSRVRPEKLAEGLVPLHQAGMPVVTFGSEVAAERFDHVESDHEAGGYDLTRFLIERGRRRILQHTGDGTTLRWKEQRRAGYERAMREAGLEPLPELVVPPLGPGDPSLEDCARQQMGFLFEHCQGPQPVDALMALTDAYVFPLARACELLGRDPVADLDIVGYDNYYARSIHSGDSRFVPLATVDKDNYRSGRSLARVLQRRLADPDSPVIAEMVAPRVVRCRT